MRISKASFLLILFSLIFCLFTSYLSCERDFSPVKIIVPPDTTSHNFTWTIDTFGIGGRGSSYLLDVAIVNENDIWAVGEIHTAETDTFDSLGNWVPPYNAVHWNGQQWQLERIYAVTSYGDTSRGPIRTVFAFSPIDIWTFSQAGSYSHWNGIRWKTEYVTERVGSINKIWGASSNDIYFVGNNGGITHYNGSWQKLESGTSVDIQDIWGAKNAQSGEWEILAVASELFQPPQARELLQIKGTNVSAVSDSGLPLDLRSLWFVPAQKYYVAGNGLYFNSVLGQPWQYDDSQPLFYKDAIRGNAENDIVIAGSFGNVSHFNGVSWRHYELSYFYGRYHSVSIKGDIVVAVGEIGGGVAIILNGIRN